MIKEAIIKIVDKKDLTYDEAYQVMDEIMTGKTTPTQNAAFLAALSTKSTKAETIDEISGCAAAMRDHALKVDNPYKTLEIVGTGGDGAGSFNISTTSAFVISASKAKVSKHGNRAASSKSGAADVLEALGVQVLREEDEDIVSRFLSCEAGAGFAVEDVRKAPALVLWPEAQDALPVTDEGFFRSSPLLGGPDGHFCCVLRRK